MDQSAVSSLDPTTIARHAIAVIEKHLHHDGLKVCMGAELEFSIYFKPDAPALRDPVTRHDPLELGDGRTRTLFPHSRLVHYAYREAAYGPGLRQYEVVTDHQHPIPIAQLPRALDALRRVLLMGDLAAPAAGPDHPRFGSLYLERRQRADWFAANVERVSLESDSTLFNTNGLHLNFSLLPVHSYKPLPLGQSSALGAPLCTATQQLFARERALLTSTSSQNMRWRSMENSDGQPDVRFRMMHGYPYLENKAPGADCNATYAVLLQMAAIYKALHVTAHDPSLETILNGLEPELGTRFMRAANAHPARKSFAPDLVRAAALG